MNERNLSPEQLERELESLRQEVATLKTEKAACEFQQQLLENLLESERFPDKGEVLKASLQTTLDLVTALTNAETGSLFLLETSGKVVDAILSRSEVTPEQRAKLIGSVRDQGLARWVRDRRQVGLITDTEQDSRCFQLKQYSTALNNELETGRQIQRDFLPDNVYQPPNWELAACFHPAKQVAGDFYDTFPLGNYVGLVIADVCDKGVGAALFMALMRSLIRVFSGQTQLDGLSIIAEEDNSRLQTAYCQTQALQAVELTNQYIVQNHWKLSMFATLFFGVLDPATGLLTYINGGHEPLFLVNNSGIKQTLKPTGPAVGLFSKVKFAIEQVQFEVGDTLLGYTDGVTECKNPDGELFTPHRLRSLLEQPCTSAYELLTRIETKLFDHINHAPQFDDITMLAVQRLKH